MPQAAHRVEMVKGSSLASQPWWNYLHATINDAFLHKRYSVYPPTWLRLDADPKKGAAGLAKELGDDGHLAVIISDEEEPVACGGVLPYRGDGWINAAFDDSLESTHVSPQNVMQADPESSHKKIPAWEICCFCTRPSQRGKGLSRLLIQSLVDFIRSRGGEKLYTNYAMDEGSRSYPVRIASFRRDSRLTRKRKACELIFITAQR
jgi:GNAT superfamily N-acetyltransferase